MKRWWTLFALLGMTGTLMAQYYAYSLNGQVRMMREGEWQNVYSTMELQETDLLQTEEYGNLTILDRTNNKMYSIQSADALPLRQLMLRQPGTRSLATEYMIGMYKKLFNKERTKGIETGGGVTYRGDAEEREIARALVHTNKSSYTVSFLLLDIHTMEPIDRVQEGQPVIVQFNNMSYTPLYMNIIDTDAEGLQNALFPLDEKNTMLQLYIPALSSIRMQGYPFVFAPAGTSDRLTLVAYPYPFDLRNVIKRMAEPEVQKAVGTPKEGIGRFESKIIIL